jgi:hypothetical protein
MKKLALLLSFAFVAGVAGAQETKTTNPNPEKAAAMAAEKAAEKTHEVKAEVVAFDAMKSTLTIKGDQENKTVPVEGKAVAALKDVKPGAKLTLVCKDDATGAHQSVVDVKPAADKK